MQWAGVAIYFHAIAAHKVALIFGVHGGIAEVTTTKIGRFHFNSFTEAKTRADNSVKIT